MDLDDVRVEERLRDKVAAAVYACRLPWALAATWLGIVAYIARENLKPGKLQLVAEMGAKLITVLLVVWLAVFLVVLLSYLLDRPRESL